MKKLLIYYFLISLLILVFFLIGRFDLFLINKYIYIINISFLLSYFFILFGFVDEKMGFYSEKNLIIITLTYSLFGVLFLNFFYFQQTGSFFSINAVDSYTYNNIAIEMNKYSFFKGIDYFFETGYSVGEFGACIYISTLYRIIESQLFVNLVNAFLLGYWGGILLFRIGRNFMSNKYAWFAALSFCTSSYIIFYESTGLKESLFTLLVIATFYHFFVYNNKRKTTNLVYSIFFGVTIIGFRPVVAGMILISIFTGILLSRNLRTRNIVLVFLSIFLFIFLLPIIETLFTQFSSFSNTINVKRHVVQDAGAENVAIGAAFLSSFIGPLPTILARVGKEVNAIYSMGLIFKIFITSYFYFGIFHIIKNKVTMFYPLVLMIFIEIISLLYIMESFQLRFHLMHLPFIYIISFYYIEQQKNYDSKIRYRNKKIISWMNVLFILVLFFWNYRVM